MIMTGRDALEAHRYASICDGDGSQVRHSAYSIASRDQFPPLVCPTGFQSKPDRGALAWLHRKRLAIMADQPRIIDRDCEFRNRPNDIDHRKFVHTLRTNMSVGQRHHRRACRLSRDDQQRMESTHAPAIFLVRVFRRSARSAVTQTRRFHFVTLASASAAIVPLAHDACNGLMRDYGRWSRVRCIAPAPQRW